MGHPCRPRASSAVFHFGEPTSRLKAAAAATAVLVAASTLGWCVAATAAVAKADGRLLARAVHAMEVGDPDAARRLFARMPADAGRVNAAINAGPLRGLRQDPTRHRVVMMTVGIGDVFADVRETIAAKTLFAIVAASPSPHEEPCCGRSRRR